ncbi:MULTISPECIES: sulfur carrier protein ThiS [Helicobacter]|uniref:Sulfur carrier protein ThiS n=1 Tax=Helicobacter ibis TaxID=2962633 RepID=A0ABT4VCY7_9HELI|nr:MULTISPECIES: sulfur carrier protein ThiS [Helicobacter]MDA3966667.1 sulfur carrier protein ThiS [Helicobacter sp. WB40]MDA3968565.1 sulfur carrier protein ThiS [Helicobacter ibis]
MNIKLNGQHISTDSKMLLELLQEYSIDTKSIAVAINMEIIKQEKWATTSIKNNDVIECLSFFGGG